MLYFVLLSAFYFDTIFASCMERSFGMGKIICVCNRTYCDELEMLKTHQIGNAVLYETNKAGARFRSTVVQFSTDVNPGIPVVAIKEFQVYQSILGFGGAFTDAAGISIKSLPLILQEQVLMSYFSEKGLSYNMGRIPIGGTDCSTHLYTYDDGPEDFELKRFRLADEDHLYKIPLIKKAASITKNKLLLFGSAWTAPDWMKTNRSDGGPSYLKGQPGGRYFQAWADYYVRFLQEYKKNNVNLWGITLLNQPYSGCTYESLYPILICLTPEEQRDFLKFHLGPSLQKAGFGMNNLKLIILDDVTSVMLSWSKVILDDEESAKYVSGIGFHWYDEYNNTDSLLDATHRSYPDLFLLSTEASTGAYSWEFPKVDLGNWDRAERYAFDILQDLSHWAIGWIDWNLALNSQGGPNWLNKFLDSPIIINAKDEEFYKQPMYYALAQFSNCLPRGSFRIGLQIPDGLMNPKKLLIAAFRTPKGDKVVIALNRYDTDVHLALHDASRGYLNIIARAHGIQSYIWS